jgi:hypothetical protein
MADTAAHLVDRVPSLGFGSAIAQEDLSELGFHLEDRLSYLGPGILPTITPPKCCASDIVGGDGRGGRHQCEVSQS